MKTPEGRVLRIADLVDDDPAKRDRVSRPEGSGAEEQPRSCRHHHRARDGEGRLRLDLVRARANRRISSEPDGDRADHRTRDARCAGQDAARFTNLIAEPDASEEAVTEAVNDTLKAIAASLLMEQVLAPRFEFKPKNAGKRPDAGFDYGPGGYDPSKCNVGINKETGQFQIEIKGLAEPKSSEADRICQEDLNEVVAAFVQDKTALERGLFDEELVPKELTRSAWARSSRTNTRS